MSDIERASTTDGIPDDPGAICSLCDESMNSHRRQLDDVRSQLSSAAVAFRTYALLVKAQSGGLWDDPCANLERIDRLTDAVLVAHPPEPEKHVEPEKPDWSCVEHETFGPWYLPCLACDAREQGEIS